ncbi:MAG: DEAD/DEAH box helicase, partial [Alphaproteobacteria bacterium]|nr:DEAD/DEAH box helicase [Alphaproteobacteria bacterium]
MDDTSSEDDFPCSVTINAFFEESWNELGRSQSCCRARQPTLNRHPQVTRLAKWRNPSVAARPSRHIQTLRKPQLIEFEKLGLSAPILKTLADAGYSSPTPIQTEAVPLILAGHDLLGIAQTGTGKTAAFSLPVLHRLIAERKAPPPKGCRVLILSPTRELASQIADNLAIYGAGMGLSFATVFGGVNARPQIRALARGVDVLVATPGRLLDHISTGVARLDGTEVLILDEADQMLDLGFLKPIRSIVARLPRDRQTLLFSATMPPVIEKLAADFLRKPKRISVTPVSSTTERIAQRVIHIAADDKRDFLADLITRNEMFRTLVFTRTKRGADRLAKRLEVAGISVSAIHGNKSQPQRERALEAFRKAKIQVLVATDIAARGIDVHDITHVINFELPEVPEAYVHRIGRTARAGASGSAISLCDPSERKYLQAIEKLIRRSIPSERHLRASGSPQTAAPWATAVQASGEEPSTGVQKSRGRGRSSSGRASGTGRGAPAHAGKT